MTHEELEEAVPLYAVGALERSERQALEAHLLSGCAACHGALKEYQTVASLLPFGLTPATPPNTLKASLMAAPTPIPGATESDQAAARSSLEPGEWMNHLFPPIAPVYSQPLRVAGVVLGTALLVGGGYTLWSYNTQTTQRTNDLQALRTAVQQETARVAALQADLKERDQTVAGLTAQATQRDHDADELHSRLNQQEAELEDLRTQLAQQAAGARPARRSEEFSALVKGPGTTAVALGGSDLAKTAGALLLFDAAVKQAWLYAYNLPALPSGKTYQLWAIDDRPINAGVFDVDVGHKGRLMVKTLTDFSRLKKFAVTMEPAGGVSQPTGGIYLIGQL